MVSVERTGSRGSGELPAIPIIGRGVELRELDEALGRAITTREPQIVTILGGPGIGKTRLLNEFLSRVKSRERRVRAYRGGSRERGPTFGIVQRLLRARFGILEGEAEEVVLEKVRKQVGETLEDRRVAEFLHFLGVFLGVKFPESPFTRAVEEDHEQHERIGRAVLRRFFEVDSIDHPLILCFEELHHSSDDALDLIEYLNQSLRDAPILVINVARPELLSHRPTFFDAGGSRHTRLDVSPLSPDDAAKLMTHLLAPCGDVPEALVDVAVDVAGGSPYLLEQMLGAYFTAGALREEKGRYEVDLDRLDDAQLPLNVEDAIRARIGSLAPAERQLLETASAMGGVFWFGALVAYSRVGAHVPELWGGQGTSTAHLRDMMRSLEERDYVLPLPDSTIPGEIEYAFKHNLERETLHKLASEPQLRKVHRVIAQWLEFRLSDRGEEHCELLAQHYERAGEKSNAARHYLLAGDQARARYSNQRAADYYEKGLTLLGDDDVKRRVDGLHHYGDVLQLCGRNEEALAVFHQMLDLAFRLDLKAKGGAAHNRIGRLYRAIGHLEEAMRHLGTGHALFDRANDARGVASSLDDIGKVHWMRGAYEPAERFMKQALERRIALADARGLALSYNNLGLVYQDSGRFTEAVEAFQEALVRRREIEDRPGISQTLNNLGTIHQDNGAHERAVALYTEALAVAREVGDRMRQAVILTNLGESRYRQKEPAEAIKVLKQAESLSESLGDRILEGEIMRGLAKAHMLVHDITLAREYIARSVKLFEASKSKPFLGVALRTQGEILSAGGWGGPAAEAKMAFERSIQLFEELGNDVELARCYESYAQFLEQQGEDTHPGTPMPTRDATELSALRARAHEIRVRISNSAEYELPKDGTNPRVQLPSEDAPVPS